MNAALVNAIAERLRANWAPLRVETDIVLKDAESAAETVADWVAALPHGYTAPDVLAAIRGEDVSPDKGRVYVSDSPLLDRIAAEERGEYTETTGAGLAPASPDDDAATISAASAAAPVSDPYFLLRDHVASVAAVLRAEATGDERDGVWEEGYSDALADLLEVLGVPR